MPRCQKALNRDIHEAITEEREQISDTIETLRRNREQSDSPTEDSQRIEQLSDDCKILMRQSSTLYDQFVISEERRQQMHVAYGRLAQIWLKKGLLSNA
ncbi:hypothetical protein Dda_8750 [Drechslerella dactyloides]|uniref:Uncharacterized protein n=1 Tax=Drechslerella dactyloides TaxID=74499 RepID=A0AAD6IQV7_DREDA|nr:hypothetical protein Dda_8750 [Drechslerella dactyloides]